MNSNSSDLLRGEMPICWLCSQHVQRGKWDPLPSSSCIPRIKGEWLSFQRSLPHAGRSRRNLCWNSSFTFGNGGERRGKEGSTIMEENQPMNLGTTNEPQEVRIGTTLTLEEGLYFLKEYKDVFACSYDDMHGLSTDRIAKKRRQKGEEWGSQEL